MKKIALILITTISIIACSQAQKTDFTKETLAEKVAPIDGTSVTFADILAKHKGKTVVLEFWASWCGDCVKAMPKMKELQANHPEADYVFISMDKTPEKWKAGIEKHVIKGDHYLVTDPEGMRGKLGKSVDLDWIPRYMIIDKNGKIALYRAVETDFETIHTTLNTLK